MKKFSQTTQSKHHEGESQDECHATCDFKNSEELIIGTEIFMLIELGTFI